MRENPHAGHRKRMIDKFLTSNGELPAHELLEILLYSAIPRVDTNLIAHNLIDAFGSLRGVLTAEKEELMSVEGVGLNTASFIILTGKLLGVMSEFRFSENVSPKMFSFDLVKKELLRRFNGFRHEQVVLYLLDSDFLPIYTAVYSNGKREKAEMDVQDVAKKIAVFKPMGVLLVHNHLSGNPEPSVKDDIATHRLNEICRVFGAKFLDHVIYSNGEFFSYQTTGRLEQIKTTRNIEDFLSDGSFGGEYYE